MLPYLTFPFPDLDPEIIAGPSRARPIFVIDGDAVAQGLIGQALSSAGLVNPVEAFCDGQSAISKMHDLVLLGSAHVPALVVVACQVLACEGIAVVRWMRSTTGLELVPVVMLSSDDDAVQVRQAYDLGVSSYLVKPLAFSVLGATVRNLGLAWQIA